MYQSGELDDLMDQFERNLKEMPIYVGGAPERADQAIIDNPDGTTSRRYINGQYYCNGKINNLFTAYMWGYMYGKAVSI